MVRMLHLADLHLGWTPNFLGAKAGARQRERDALLRRVVDLVLEEQLVDVVFIAGDLFETHTPPESLVESVIADLNRLVAAGVHVVTVPGNHDEITYPDSVYRQHGHRWPGVLIQNPMPDYVTTLDVKGTAVHVYGVAYTGGLTRTSPPVDDFPKRDEPGLHVALLHGSLDWDAGERSLPISSRGLARAGYDYVALGHIHRPDVHDLGGVTAVYAGATEGKSFRDPGTGMLCFVELDGETPRIRWRDLRVREIREQPLDVTDLEDAAAIANRALESADPEAIVRLRLTGAAPEPLSADGLAERVRDAYYYVEIVDETMVLDERVIDALAAEPTVRGQFVRRMQQGMATAEDDDAKALWQGALRRGLAALEGTGS